MATKINNDIVITVNALTGEILERVTTAEEIANRKIMHSQMESEQSKLLAQTQARESALAKLAALGLSADEIAAL